MPDRDRITIEQGGRTLSGSGDLVVSTVSVTYQAGTNQDGSVYRIARPAIPFVKGYVVFDGRVNHADVMNMTNATARCELSDGRRPVFNGATFLRADPGSHASGYTVHLVGTVAE